MRLLVGWIVATLASEGGIYCSFQGDLPTGTAIVCTLGLALLLAGGLTRLRRPAAGTSPLDALPTREVSRP